MQITGDIICQCLGQMDQIYYRQTLGNWGHDNLLSKLIEVNLATMVMFEGDGFKLKPLVDSKCQLFYQCFSCCKNLKTPSNGFDGPTVSK